MPLEVELRGDRQLVLTRRIAATPDRAFAAHTQSDLVRQWMLGPGDDGEMTVCDHDPRPGGAFRMAWRSRTDRYPPFQITGEYIALDPPHRIEHVERMHLPEMTTGDNHIVTEFAAEGDGTTMTMTMTFESAEARQGALGSGMTDGMEACYILLDRLPATT